MQLLLSDLQHSCATVIVNCGRPRDIDCTFDSDNDVYVQLVMRHQGDGATGSALARIRYITQVKSRPPTFAVFVSGGLDFPENARRFLIKALQKDFEFEGVPIRAEIRYRKRKQNVGQSRRSPMAANQQLPVVQKRAARQAA